MKVEVAVPNKPICFCGRKATLKRGEKDPPPPQKKEKKKRTGGLSVVPVPADIISGVMGRHGLTPHSSHCQLWLSALPSPVRSLSGSTQARPSNNGSPVPGTAGEGQRKTLSFLAICLKLR